jgi:hypothetical protein
VNLKGSEDKNGDNLVMEIEIDKEVTKQRFPYEVSNCVFNKVNGGSSK